MLEPAATPEEDLRCLQADLDEKLGSDAPKLGTHPDRVKKTAGATFIGAVGISLLVGLMIGDVRGVAEATTWCAALACAAVAFGYERVFWRKVDGAREMIRQRAA